MEKKQKEKISQCSLIKNRTNQGVLGAYRGRMGRDVDDKAWMQLFALNSCPCCIPEK